MWGCLIPTGLGLAYAAAANSSVNRTGNPLGGLGEFGDLIVGMRL